MIGGTVAIVLAAGQSSRMGRPKLSLPVDERGTTMLQQTLQQLEPLGLPITVVTGRYPAALGNRPSGTITTVHNENWPTGMAGSIATGVAAARPAARIAYLIALGDQPLVTTQQYLKLLRTFDTAERPIVATTYPEGPGVPAVFAGRYADALADNEGKGGAKHLLRSGAFPVHAVDFGRAPVDIDTTEDYTTHIGLALPE